MRPQSRGRVSRTASALALFALIGAGCGTPRLERLRVKVHATYTHDPTSFTEGLQLADDVLYESTGRQGTSSLRAMDPATGRELARRSFPAPVFAEGIGIDGDRIVQLTWKDGRAYVSSRVGLRPAGTLSYDGEGWGLCRAGDEWIMSNGSDILTVRDRFTFAPRRTIHVQRDGVPVPLLNELECVGDRVYANVWKTNEIVRIESDGRVSAVIDASGLPVDRPSDPDAVLNGIAYLPASGRFLVTGKLWPTMFEVTFE